MSLQERKTPPGLLLAIIASATAIFVADLRLPLGIAAWVLYFVPIALSKFAPRPGAPLVVAAVCSVMLALGFYLSPGQGTAAARFAPLNRGFGLVTMWSAAVIGRRFILARLAVQREDWLKAAQTGLSERMQGELSHTELGGNILSFLARYLGAQVGAIYMSDGNALFTRSGTHAIDAAVAGPATVRSGQGLIGQVAQDNQLQRVVDVPEKYLDVRSGVGTHRPRELVIAPAAVDGNVYAVVELGFFNAVEPTAVELFTRASASIATAVRSVNYRSRQKELLTETQQQAEELQTQQEELRVQNEELEQQSSILQQAQARLENQHAELEQINSQLEEQAKSLERQRDELSSAQGELQRTNTYKSEFLANMSHELRTPLNSALILAKLLLQNREGNLTAEQVKFAQTIYSAGNDLLTLINDILDLSKIEAGKLDVRPESIVLARAIDELRDTFAPIAEQRRLELVMRIHERVPTTIITDVTRFQQILKNLLSNALKFTEQGGVQLDVSLTAAGTIAFAVKDTGIGIAPDQQQAVFEAFRQADGTTNRKYGGTGLGLSISRDLARLLGGELNLESAVGRGSTFTLVLPERAVEAEAPAMLGPAGSVERARPVAVVEKPRATAPAAPEQIPDDDRAQVTPGSRAILIIEDDVEFASILSVLARELDFKVLLAENAQSGLAAVERYRPSAIVLDVGLPDRSGLSVLDALKQNPTTRHIPVHVISASDYTQTALQMGAAGYAIKPVQREQLRDALRRLELKFTQKLRRVLVVEDDQVHRESTSRLIESDDVQCVAVGTAADALQQLSTATFDCMILDLTLPDRSGFELLEEMSQKEQYAFPPVIVYTGQSLSAAEEQQLRRFSSSIVIKGARSPERLLDEVTLFLHQVESELPPDRQRMLRSVRHRESVFEGRRVLVVEDDVRNVFALTSVLEPKGAKVDIARNGREALTHLKSRPAPDLILMDIMMPEMNGLDATKEIRKMPAFAKTPIIALTAKAMADDRLSCLEAGANDYIAKPLDVDKLLSLARVWMPK